MTVLLIGGCLAATISLFETLRKGPLPFRWIARLVESSVIISFGFNFAVSFLLTMLIGVGMVAGAANLIASIIFPIYVLVMKKKRGSVDIAISKQSSTKSRQRKLKSVIVKHATNKEIENDIYDNEKKLVMKKTASDIKPEEIGEKVGNTIKKGITKGKNIGKTVLKQGKKSLTGFWRGLKKGLK